MSGKLKVSITVVPTQGRTTTKTVEVKQTGAKLGDVLKAAGISADNKDVLLNGKPASLDAYVEQGDQVDARMREAKVEVSERPRGS